MGLKWPRVHLPPCYNRSPCRCSSSSTGAVKVDGGQQGAHAEAEQARQHSITGPGDTDVIWDTGDVFARGEGPAAEGFCHGGAVMGWDSQPAATTRFLMRCPVKKSETWTWLAAAAGLAFAPQSCRDQANQVFGHMIISWDWELSILLLQHSFIVFIDSAVSPFLVAWLISKLDFPQIFCWFVISVFVDVKSENLLFTKMLPKGKRAFIFQKLRHALLFGIWLICFFKHICFSFDAATTYCTHTR